MSFVAVAIGGSAVVGAVSSSRAARAQRKSADAATDLQREMFYRTDELNEDTLRAQDRTARFAYNRNNAELRALRDAGLAGADRAFTNNVRELGRERSRGERLLAATRDANIAGYRPYAERGTNALAAYASELGIGARPEGFTGLSMSPAAQFLLEQGRETVEGGAAGAGGLYSGATLEALERTRAGLAAQDRTNQMGQLFSLAGMGLDATGAIAGERTAANTGINALRGMYTGQITGQRDQLFDRNYGIRSDFTGARTGNRNLFAANLGTARTNRANLYGSAATQYATNAGNAMMAGGEARAAGALGLGNALTGAAGNLTWLAGMGQMPNIGGIFNRGAGTNYAAGAAPVTRPMPRPW